VPFCPPPPRRHWLSVAEEGRRALVPLASGSGHGSKILTRFYLLYTILASYGSLITESSWMQGHRVSLIHTQVKSSDVWRVGVDSDLYICGSLSDGNPDISVDRLIRVSCAVREWSISLRADVDRGLTLNSANFLVVDLPSVVGILLSKWRFHQIIAERRLLSIVAVWNCFILTFDAKRKSCNSSSF